MGFWDNLGDGIKTLSEKADNYNQEVSKYMDQYDRYSTADLQKKAKSGGPLAKKTAILKILRNRGVVN
ncbi:hypothetical protein ACIQXV_26670 [Neobacillus sp. NPDC097160]|uniref:hypothetical protein n=1 Tax=Neobacillus sp. NPDC097160 TaxID=3364298 RepID=UPI00380B4026